MTNEREPSFTPFADDEMALTMGDFNVENGTNRIAIFGSIDITRDAKGLKHAQELRDLFDAIVRQIEAADPAAPAAPAGVKTISNPFDNGS